MKRIMVVDDEFIVRVGFKSITNWEAYGYTIVAEASDGEDALDKIAKTNPQIVLTDLMMDNMDGFELISRCQRDYPQIKFVVLSSYNDFDSVKRAMKLGASDYIFKLTVKPDEIIKILDELTVESPTQENNQSQLDSVVRGNMQGIKKSLFNKCVFHSYTGSEDMLTQFRTLGLRINPAQPYVVMFFNINEYTKSRIARNGHDDMQLIKFSMENIADEVLCKNCTVEVFDYERSGMAALVMADCHSGLLYERLSEAFAKIHSYYKQYLGFAVSGAVSPIACGVDEIGTGVHICQASLRRIRENERLTIASQGERPEITKAQEYVMHHLHEALSVAEVAQTVGMSESYFSTVFKKDTGLSYVDYVNRVRIEHAALLLEETGGRIADIAQQVGIDNPNYFSVLFKKIMGISPNVYRDGLQKPE